MPLRGGTFNLRYGRSPAMVGREVLRILTQNRLDFLAVQEAASYRDELGDIPGFRYFTGGDNNVGVLIRFGVRHSQVRHRAYGDGWRSVLTGGRVKPRTFLRVTVSRVRVGVVHLPAKVDLARQHPRDRWQDYVATMKAVETFLRLPWPRKRVVLGDWNATAENPWRHAPRQVADLADAKVVSDGGVDYALVKRAGAIIKTDRSTEEQSDHEPKIVTVY